MNTHQLFDAIGQVDDDLILAADQPVMHRRKRPVYWLPAVSAAACAGLLMIGVVSWRAGSSKSGLVSSAAVTAADASEEVETAVAPDEPLLNAANPYAEDNGSPVKESAGSTYKAEDSADSRIALAAQHAVMLEGILYYDSGTISDTAPDAAPDGTITSTVDDLSFPNEDGQSNFGTGYAYRYGNTDGTLEVLVDDEWHIFATS